VTEVVFREHVRTSVLLILRAIYPKPLSLSVLQKSLNRSRAIEIAINPLLAELHYLDEKQLIRLKVGTSPMSLRAQLTARGIDFLDGHIHEVGLASPDLFD